MKEYKWGVCVPLLGGMAIGNMKATDNLPSFAISWKEFADNDENFKKLFPTVPFFTVNEDGFELSKETKKLFKEVDFVSSVCPCAGLSMLNTGGNADPKYGRGSDAIQNQWMYLTTEFILEHVSPKVLWGENAPGLYTDLGKGVRENLAKLAKKYGYSFSIVKTNTKYHGIPQNRPRSFYFFWKSKTAPIMNWYKQQRPKLAEYLAQVDKNSPYHNLEKATNDLLNDPFYLFTVDKYGKDYRKIMIEKNSNSIFNFLEREEQFENCLEYFKKKLETETDEEKKKQCWARGIKSVEHILKKHSQNKGYWDWSPHYFYEVTNATVSRNMENTMHPTEERFLTLAEHVLQMGLPSDFRLADERKWNHIAQNVPVTTARDWTYEVLKFLNNELVYSNTDYLKQDNNSETMEKCYLEDNESVSDFIQLCIN